MRNNIIGYKQIDHNIFALDRPYFSNTPYTVVRIYGEEKNLEELHKIIRHNEIFPEDILMNLNLKFREI